jgi:alanine racemase
VDLHALRENLAQIRNLAGPARKILTVVKADAYGHGLRQTAAVLMQSGTDIFGVANLAEARAIRTVGRGWPILMLGACLRFEVEAAVRDSIMPSISNVEEARLFSAAAVRLNKIASVHIKVDTGMGRLGAASTEVRELVRAIEALPSIRISGLFSHYSAAEDEPEFTAEQRQSFAALVEALAREGRQFESLHISNSGGLLLEPGEPGNVVRAGLLVYGIVPRGARLNDSSAPTRFRPALSWKCRVTLVKVLPAGASISYGRTFITQLATRVAIVAAGYGDGYLRAGSNRARVLIAGQLCPVLGRITMDQMVVDVSRVDQVAPGDEVVLIGEQAGQTITANEVADWCGTIPWEVLTNITYRVPRVYRGGHAA